MSTVDWRHEAACAGKWEVFERAGYHLDRKPPRPGHDKAQKRRDDAINAALDICSTCPVLHLCADAAINTEAGQPLKDRWGLFGGMTPQRRYDLDRALGWEGKTA